jgi:hypothetical protein
MESLICNPKQDVVAHACNPGTGRLRQEDHEFKGSMGYIKYSRPARIYIVRLSQETNNL